MGLYFVMDNPLSNLVIDCWYKALTVLGAVIAAGACFVTAQVFNNLALFLGGLALFFWGVGE